MQLSHEHWSKLPTIRLSSEYFSDDSLGLEIVLSFISFAQQVGQKSANTWFSLDSDEKTDQKAKGPTSCVLMR